MPSKSRSDGPSPAAPHDDRSVNRAWERHNAGISPATSVRSVIQQSWVRSTSAGIDPLYCEAPAAEGATELEKLRQSNRELCRAARGSLDKIGRMLHGAEAMLILTDEKGLVIEAIGDPKTLAAGRNINLHVGALWNERAVGTNGIGTTLWAGEPMFVHGGEHYVEGLKEWSCAAAPIRNPIDQSVIGAVDSQRPDQDFPSPQYRLCRRSRGRDPGGLGAGAERGADSAARGADRPGAGDRPRGRRADPRPGRARRASQRVRAVDPA